MSFPIRMIVFGIAIVVIPVIALLYATEQINTNQKGKIPPDQQIEQILKAHNQDLLSLPGVNGTAIGVKEGKPCIKVYVSEKSPELDQKIPSQLSGYPVEVEEKGEIQTLPQNPQNIPKT
jgi:hypothetical protein